MQLENFTKSITFTHKIFKKLECNNAKFKGQTMSHAIKNFNQLYNASFQLILFSGVLPQVHPCPCKKHCNLHRPSEHIQNRPENIHCLQSEQQKNTSGIDLNNKLSCFIIRKCNWDSLKIS